MEPTNPDQVESKFPALRRALEDCADPMRPSASERQAIFAEACRIHEALVDAGESSRSTKTELFEFLGAGVQLAASRDALRKQFIWYLNRWRKGGHKADALADRRPEANRQRGFMLSDEDRDIVTAHSVFGCDGRVSQGWRECLERQWLSEALIARYQFNPATKSHVPPSIREAVRCEVRMLRDHHHGPRAARDNGAYVDRYWGKVPSGTWYCMDDATLPVYYWVQDRSGKRILIRGQFLLAIDARSTCILGYILLSERNYNARAIRTLITRTCDKHGLPTKGFYFERGIWESSQLLHGVSGDDVPYVYSAIETGLSAYGLKFKHAIRARSKPVERVIGAIQNPMCAERGYSGRDERHDGFESIEKQKLAVERGADPSQYFYSLDQWENRIAELCAQYNSETQDGKHMIGLRLSPAEAMERFKDRNDPPIKFGPEIRPLFSNYRRPVRVTRNGITLQFGKRRFVYHDEETGAKQGEMVIAWFDPEAPETLIVTDLDKRNPFCVGLAPTADAMADPDDPVLAEAIRLAEAHNSYGSMRCRILESKYQQKFRPNIVDRENRELAHQINTQRAQAAARRERGRQFDARARQVYGELGWEVPAGCDEESLRAAENYLRIRKEALNK